MDPALKGSRDRWALFEDTLCQGVIPVGTVEDDCGVKSWLTFETEREAQLEIVEDLEDYIRQFKVGERGFEDLIITLFAQPVTEWPEEGILTTEDGEYNLKDYT